MKVSRRWGLGLVAAAGGMSACTSILGGFDFEGPPTGTGGGGTGGATTSSSSSTSSSTSSTSSSTSTSSSSGTGGAMACSPGTTQACYGGPAGTEGKGICTGGMETCNAQGTAYGACAGEVTPKGETCAATDDEDCDGLDCVMWANGYGDPVDAQATHAIALDPSDGSVVVIGDFRGTMQWGSTTLSAVSGNGDLFVARIGADGSPVWAVSFSPGGGQGQAVAIDQAGSVYVGGLSFGNMTVGAEVVSKGSFLIKLGKDGAPIWSRSLGNTPTGNYLLGGGVSALAVAPDGDLVAVGQYLWPIDFGGGSIQPLGTSAQPSGFVAKLRSSDGVGTTASSGSQWTQVFANAATPPRLGIDGMGAVYVGATFSDTTQLGTFSLTSQGGTDIALAKFSNSGTTLGAERMGGAADQKLDTLAVTPFGSVTIGGHLQGTMALMYSSDTLTAKSAAGEGFVLRANYAQPVLSYTWGMAFGIPSEVLDIGLTATGDVRVLGWFTGLLDLGAGAIDSGPNQMLLLAALSGSDGAVQWNRGWPYPPFGSSPLLPLRLVVTPSGGSLATGTLYGGPFDLGAGMLIQPTDAAEAWVARFGL